ncbi:MAG: O-antigen ligase family protein [Nitrospirota bacterium]
MAVGISLMAESAGIAVGIVAFILFLVFSLGYINLTWPIFFLIFLLPFQNILLMLVSYFFDISKAAITALTIWKEILVVMYLLYIIAKNKFHRLNLTYADYFLIVYCLWATLYFIGFNTLFHSEIKMFYQLESYRATVVFAGLYFLGRFVEHDETALRKFIAALIFASFAANLFGLFERFFFSAGLWAELGRNFWMSKGTDSFQNGLPINFYTYLSYFKVRRLISSYTDPLTVGFANILVLVLLYQMITGKMSGSVNIFNKFKYAAFIIIGVATLLSLTRAAILGALIGIFVSSMFYLSKRNLALGALIAASLSCAILFSSVGQRLIMGTINLRDPSTIGHIGAYAIGIQNIISHPMGMGLGYGGYVTQLTGQGSKGAGESLFLTIAIEKGIAGLIIFLSFIFSLLIFLKKNLIHLKDNPVSAILPASIFSSAISYFLASLTTEHWQAFVSSGMFWLFCGMIVNEIQKRKHENSFN